MQKAQPRQKSAQLTRHDVVAIAGIMIGHKTRIALGR